MPRGPSGWVPSIVFAGLEQYATIGGTRRGEWMLEDWDETWKDEEHGAVARSGVSDPRGSSTRRGSRAGGENRAGPEHATFPAVVERAGEHMYCLPPFDDSCKIAPYNYTLNWSVLGLVLPLLGRMAPMPRPPKGDDVLRQCTWAVWLCSVLRAELELCGSSPRL